MDEVLFLQGGGSVATRPGRRAALRADLSHRDPLHLHKDIELIKMILRHMQKAGKCTYRVLVSVRQLSQNMCPGLGADSTVERCLMEPNSVDPNKPQPKVVIVGAGISGLSAAQRLAYCGITDIVVLEATDRPGGRIHSCWLGDTVVELGAQWIYGASPANSVFTLAAREGLFDDSSAGYMETSRSNFFSSKYSDALYVTSDGRAVDAGLAKAATSSFANIESQVRSLFTIGANRPRGSLLDFAEKRIKQEVSRYPEFQRYDAAKVMHAQLSKLRSEAGASLGCISADQLGSAVVIPGGDVRVPIGYVGVLAPLLRDLPDCSVRYCKVVENVRWGGGGGQWGAPRAVVRTCDGEEFPADYVIVTMSLGVLKKSADTLFSPGLPAEKMEAIKLLGMGSLNKIFLEYRKPFWSLGRGSIVLAWSPDELKQACGWARGITSIEEVPGSRCTLCVTVAGEDACCIEGMADSAIAGSLTSTLRQFTGDPGIPFPNYIMRSRWTTDPFVRGARSFLSLDSTVGQQCDLGAPIPEGCGADEAVLMFAGEATCPGYYGTVHGARISGLREAERILALNRKNSR